MDDIKPLDPEVTRNVIEEQLAAWRLELERTRIQNKVAVALEDKDMQKRVEAMATRCVKAIEHLIQLLKETKESDGGH